MEKRPIIIILVVLAILIFAGLSYTGNIIYRAVSYSDFDITTFRWESCYTPEEFCENPPIKYSSEYGLIGEGNLIIYSEKDKISAELYVKGREPRELYLKSGENIVHVWGLSMDSLYEPVTFKVCFSNSRVFRNDSSDNICKEKSFPTPEISLSVTPDPLRFYVMKSESWEVPRQDITITNTGEIPILVNVLLPSYIAEGLDYPKYKPQYPTFGFVSEGETYNINLLAVLAPGELGKYDVGVTVGNFGEFNTPLGTYNSIGYVYSYGTNFNTALFKKEFTIITDVI